MKRTLITFAPHIFLAIMCWHMGYGPMTWEFYATLFGSTFLEAIYITNRLEDYTKNESSDDIV